MLSAASIYAFLNITINCTNALDPSSLCSSDDAFIGYAYHFIDADLPLFRSPAVPIFHSHFNQHVIAFDLDGIHGKAGSGIVGCGAGPRIEFPSMPGANQLAVTDDSLP